MLRLVKLSMMIWPGTVDRKTLRWMGSIVHLTALVVAVVVIEVIEVVATTVAKQHLLLLP